MAKSSLRIGLCYFFDCFVVKVRQDKCIIHKAVYVALGIDKLEIKGVPIYTSVTEEEALMALETFASKWHKQYPQIAKSGHGNWPNLMLFLQYPNAIRSVIYTTNAIESVNSQLRNVTKNKRVFPNEVAIFKTLYLTINYITRKGTMPIQN
ncbi:transposase [Candidatus Cardinium hertigii]|uniref:Mutator family transposase n=1 Tax=Candidatus Cardinium hertigii TaxID=247481 RepID=A0A2Z3L9G4_9BACT|nr:transposase [Candidatus Cardinium hertigii]AWN82009.1 hypothetical protein DK880_00698 [Candidatus Cardinium hertigii]